MPKVVTILFLVLVSCSEDKRGEFETNRQNRIRINYNRAVIEQLLGVDEIQEREVNSLVEMPRIKEFLKNSDLAAVVEIAESLHETRYDGAVFCAKVTDGEVVIFVKAEGE